jgi:hypothetical protein
MNGMPVPTKTTAFESISWRVLGTSPSITHIILLATFQVVPGSIREGILYPLDTLLRVTLLEWQTNIQQDRFRIAGELSMVMLR